MSCASSSVISSSASKDEDAVVLTSDLNGVGNSASCYSGGVWESHGDVNFDSDDEGNGLVDDEEEDIYDSTSIPKLQFRNDMWEARWNEELKNKGKMATTTGIIRDGKLFCSIEETLYLSERGALSLVAPDDPVSLKEMYKKISGETCGCSWELFEAYRHLKSLGYIVVRHGVSWTMKSDVCKM